MRAPLCNWIGLTLAACLLAPGVASAQLQPEAGRLLVSAPELDDALFSETVILLVHYDESGAIGVFLNRPTNLAAERVFGAATQELGAYPGTVYFGGPVDVNRPVMLLRNSELGAELHVFEDVYLTVQAELFDSQPVEERAETRMRVFAGHAEWVPGQLESEISTGAWRVVEGSSSAVFAPDVETLWRSALYFNTEETVMRPDGRWKDSSVLTAARGALP